MLDSCKITVLHEEQMRRTAFSLARSMYSKHVTILLQGKLGVGKTIFTQGLAAGLGITERVTSPTYALEQHYGSGMLSHIDLYRLNPTQAKTFMERLEPCSGIRVIEWSDRTEHEELGILIKIEETIDGREIMCEFNDIPVPSDTEIDAWTKDVRLPAHIRAHEETVTAVAAKITEALLAEGRFVRPSAVRAAARTHDILRFVDFTSFSGDNLFQPAANDVQMWQTMKEQYGTPHEHAAAKFLLEQGYPEIASIVRSHRGYGTEDDTPKTIEADVLVYADKRSLMDTVVSIDERFDDFVTRYGNDAATDDIRMWRKRVREIETRLFPNGVPF